MVSLVFKFCRQFRIGFGLCVGTHGQTIDNAGWSMQCGYALHVNRPIIHHQHHHAPVRPPTHPSTNQSNNQASSAPWSKIHPPIHEPFFFVGKLDSSCCCCCFFRLCAHLSIVQPPRPHGRVWLTTGRAMLLDACQTFEFQRSSFTV